MQVICLCKLQGHATTAFAQVPQPHTAVIRGSHHPWKRRDIGVTTQTELLQWQQLHVCYPTFVELCRQQGTYLTLLSCLYRYLLIFGRAHGSSCGCCSKYHILACKTVCRHLYMHPLGLDSTEHMQTHKATSMAELLHYDSDYSTLTNICCTTYAVEVSIFKASQVSAASMFNSTGSSVLVAGQWCLSDTKAAGKAVLASDTAYQCLLNAKDCSMAILAPSS